ncbi:MAG: alkyl hydroperoxide reductase subunit F [Steroidobacteraceae bacterium]
MLDENIRQQLSTHLARISRPVQVSARLDDSEASRELETLLADLAGLSDALSVVRADTDAAVSRRPSFSLGAAGEPARVSFAGVPMGHEFTSLVLALLQAGGVPPKVDPALAARVAALPGPLDFEIYVSLSCHNCPDVVQALNAMAAINPRIRATMIDGALFQPEVEARQVLAVPAVFLNGRPFGQGRMTLAEILDRVDADGAARETAALADRAPYDVLIVGGGPAGAAAAIYAARKGIRTGVVSERFGGQVMDTMGIENFISVEYTEGPKLAAALERHVRSYGVEVMERQRAEGLEAAGADGLVGVRLEGGVTLRSRSVVLATGARWREMNVPGEREYRGRGVAYCPHCDGPLFRGKRVAVIGGGNSGVEAAIDLAGIVAEVTLLEFDGRLRADEVLQRKLRSLPNVRVIVSAHTTEVIGDGSRVTGLAWRDRGTGDEHRIGLDGVFVQIGLLPNTDWLAGAVALTPRGEIEVDTRGQTSLPGVFAAGDATTVPFKQIVIAMGEGSKAALGAFDHLMRMPADAGSAAAA